MRGGDTIIFDLNREVKRVYIIVKNHNKHYYIDKTNKNLNSEDYLNGDVEYKR